MRELLKIFTNIFKSKPNKYNMPTLSKEKRDRIDEQILLFLFTSFPKQLFTVDIAKEVARDEEFIKKTLIELESKNLVVKINKNPEGINYERRLRWRISNNAYVIYEKFQKNQPIKVIPEEEKDI